MPTSRGLHPPLGIAPRRRRSFEPARQLLRAAGEDSSSAATASSTSTIADAPTTVRTAAQGFPNSGASPRRSKFKNGRPSARMNGERVRYEKEADIRRRRPQRPHARLGVFVGSLPAARVYRSIATR
ncbi:MAG: hypothetical protein BJ554DRAFT_1533 [Olpidium bornovanus]|uniref:Uncharacterized protein n=1 Tax=Olpidium bornovanus TaxID=278681 RepID=A0A8H8DHC8_9FUNG|nr:MAG: hypothetical protein BJ554DRAFT_1533 [Olpidium bornovanus]